MSRSIHLTKGEDIFRRVRVVRSTEFRHVREECFGSLGALYIFVFVAITACYACLFGRSDVNASQRFDYDNVEHSFFVTASAVVYTILMQLQALVQGWERMLSCRVRRASRRIQKK